MRGEEKRLRRAASLRLLNKTHTFKHIAEKSDTDEVYLSQIANGYVGKGRKSPRSLSDDYAEKIERGLGLPQGWMDEDHDNNEGETPAPAIGESLTCSPAKRDLIDAIVNSGEALSDDQAKALADMISSSKRGRDAQRRK